MSWLPPGGRVEVVDDGAKIVLVGRLGDRPPHFGYPSAGRSIQGEHLRVAAELWGDAQLAAAEEGR